MSWFFGKKKTYKESPPDTPPSTEQSPSNAADDYIFIEKRSGLYPQINTDDPASGSGVYPPFGATYPPPNFDSNSTKNSAKSQKDFFSINEIPFKLCADLEKTINQDLDIDSLRINEILYFIERLQKDQNSYDFSVENSVISEMNSQNDD